MKNLPKMTANLKGNEVSSPIRNLVIELEYFTITVKPKHNFEYISDVIKAIKNIDFLNIYFRSEFDYKYKSKK